MIWNDSSIALNPDLEMLATHIAAEIRSAGPGNQQSPAMPDDHELAGSVAEFIFQSETLSALGLRTRSEASERDGAERDEPERTRRSGGILIPSDYLLIMTCRALWAVGREDAARALLRNKGPELNIVESYADALFGKGLFPCLGMHSALVRALRPASSPWSMNSPYWILNLRTVFSFLDAGLELTIWRILHALTKQLGVLWDVSRGRGTLGLNDAHYVSAHVLGFPRKSRQGRQFTAELIRYCEQDLKMAAKEREWLFTPTVMDVGA